MKLKKAVFIPALCLSLIPCAAGLDVQIQDNAGLIFASLDMGVGARALAMGDAFTAVADDSTAVYWNPAGLARVARIEAGLEFKKWFIDSYFSNISGALPLKPGTLGASLSYTGMGVIDVVDQYGFSTDQQYQPFSIALKAGYGISLFKELMIGMSAGAIFQNVSSNNEFSILADFGAIYQPFEMLSLGLVFQNLGLGSDFSLPSNVKLGIALDALNMQDHKILVSLDGSYQAQTGLIYSAGMEYTVLSLFMLRAGYNFSPGASNVGGLAGLRAGLGVKVGWLRFDYAMLVYGDMGIMHMGAINMEYGNATDAIKGMTTREFEQMLVKRYYSDGLIYYNLGDYKEAMVHMSKALVLAPNNKSVVTWANYIKKKEQAARPELTQEQKDQQEVFDRASAFYKADKYGESLAVLKSIPAGDANFQKAGMLVKSIEEKMAESDIHYVKSIKLIDAGEIVEGIKELRASLSLCPGCSDAKEKYRQMKPEINEMCKKWYLEGIDKYTNDKVDEAIRVWNQVVDLDPAGEFGSRAETNIQKAKIKLRAIEKYK